MGFDRQCYLPELQLSLVLTQQLYSNERPPNSQDEQLERFVREHPDTKLIVLETLQKVREASKDYSYGSDYELMNCLKCFADGALLMRKEKRTDLTATLDAAGRDQPDQRLHLKKNSDSLTWELECADTQPWRQPPDPVLEAVAKLSISAGEWEGSPSELARAINTSMAVNRLTQVPVIVKAYEVTA